MRNKKQRFADIATRYNVITPEKPHYFEIAGLWRLEHFKNNNPLIVEIACGRGEYTVGLGKVFPDKNFVGIDIKGDRIWVGSTLAQDESLDNVGFLRTDILFLDRFFATNEVDEIWVVFPDPRPKQRDAKRRLTHQRYIDLYKNALKPNGWIHLKTDDSDLFNYSLETIARRGDVKALESTHDLYQSQYAEQHFGIKTKYEGIFTQKGRKIKYLKFQFVEGDDL